jgi:hypothetical protein
MQSEQYSYPKPHETYERKLYRLHQKWIIEAELWLTTLVMIELSAIYRLATIFEKTNKIQNI